MSNSLARFEEIFYTDYYPGTKWVGSGGQKTIYWTDKDSSLSVLDEIKQALPLTISELRIAESAFDEWDQALESIVFEYTSDPSKAQIAIGWTNVQTGDWGYWTANWSDNIRYLGSLQLNINLRTSTLGSSINLKHTLLHEIGNLLGLGDISRSSGINSVLVDPFIITGALTEVDKAYAKLLYSEYEQEAATLYGTGDLYVGQYGDGLRNGQGTYIFRTGDVYVGQFENGKLSGQGTFTFYSGHVYVGSVANGKRDGQGKFTYADGTVKNGIWLQDTLIVENDLPPGATAVAVESIDQNLVRILVDEGVLSPEPIFLPELEERITHMTDGSKSHVLIYEGISYDVGEFDHVITTVIRNGDFTQDFRNEISDLSPDFSDVTYEGLITLVGIANIDNVVTYIAGADGNYIG